jgi:hypothetical protein
MDPLEDNDNVDQSLPQILSPSEREHKRSVSAGHMGSLATEDLEILNSMKRSAIMPEYPDRLKTDVDCFHEHVEHMQEICKMMRHVASTDSLQVAARYTEINLRIYGPQVATAATTLCMYPTSKIAKDNMDGTYFRPTFPFIPPSF